MPLIVLCLSLPCTAPRSSCVLPTGCIVGIFFREFESFGRRALYLPSDSGYEVYGFRTGGGSFWWGKPRTVRSLPTDSDSRGGTFVPREGRLSFFHRSSLIAHQPSLVIRHSLSITRETHHSTSSTPRTTRTASIAAVERGSNARLVFSLVLPLCSQHGTLFLHPR